MARGVLYVRDICNQKGIAISKLEKDCNFSNGYLNPKKLKKIPYDRALMIAEYLDISIDCLLNEDVKKAPTVNDDDERIDAGDDAQHPLMKLFYSLNKEGQEKLLGYAEDLTYNPHYKKHHSLSTESAG